MQAGQPEISRQGAGGFAFFTENLSLILSDNRQTLLRKLIWRLESIYTDVIVNSRKLKAKGQKLMANRVFLVQIFPKSQLCQNGSILISQTNSNAIRRGLPVARVEYSTVELE